MGAVAISMLLAGLVGAVVIPEAVNHELRDNDDSRGVHAMLWQCVWLWAASLLAPIGAVAVLIFDSRKPDASPSDNVQE